MSLIKLNYMFCVLENIYGSKAAISDPEAFKDKIRAIERAAKAKGLNRQNSAVSGSSFFTGAKSARSGMTSENGETQGSELLNGTADDDDDNATRRTRGIANDPIYKGIQGIFEGFQTEIDNMGTTRLQFLKRKHKGGFGVTKKTKDDTEVGITEMNEIMGTIPE